MMTRAIISRRSDIVLDLAMIEVIDSFQTMDDVLSAEMALYCASECLQSRRFSIDQVNRQFERC